MHKTTQKRDIISATINNLKLDEKGSLSLAIKIYLLSFLAQISTNPTPTSQNKSK